MSLQGGGQVFGTVGVRDDVGAKAVPVQGLGRSAADGGQFGPAQGPAVAAVVLEAVEKGIDAVGAGEDDPVIAG